MKPTVIALILGVAVATYVLLKKRQKSSFGIKDSNFNQLSDTIPDLEGDWYLFSSGGVLLKSNPMKVTIKRVKDNHYQGINSYMYKDKPVVNIMDLYFEMTSSVVEGPSNAKKTIYIGYNKSGSNFYDSYAAIMKFPFISLIGGAPDPVTLIKGDFIDYKRDAIDKNKFNVTCKDNKSHDYSIAYPEYSGMNEQIWELSSSCDT